MPPNPDVIPDGVTFVQAPVLVLYFHICPVVMFHGPSLSAYVIYMLLSLASTARWGIKAGPPVTAVKDVPPLVLL